MYGDAEVNRPKGLRVLRFRVHGLRVARFELRKSDNRSQRTELRKQRTAEHRTRNNECRKEKILHHSKFLVRYSKQGKLIVY
jgi:hypothetical protein